MGRIAIWIGLTVSLRLPLLCMFFGIKQQDTNLVPSTPNHSSHEKDALDPAPSPPRNITPRGIKSSSEPPRTSKDVPCQRSQERSQFRPRSHLGSPCVQRPGTPGNMLRLRIGDPRPSFLFHSCGEKGQKEKRNRIAPSVCALWREIGRAHV